MKPHNTLTASEAKLAALFDKVASKSTTDCDCEIIRLSEQKLQFCVENRNGFVVYLGTSAENAARDLKQWFDISNDKYFLMLLRAAQKYDISKLSPAPAPTQTQAAIEINQFEFEFA